MSKIERYIREYLIDEYESICIHAPSLLSEEVE